jgi:GNAT superfamily N-acetyltransferase
MIEAQPGVVAISGSKLVGYLTGYAHIPNFKGISPGVYVPEWAYSVPETPDQGRILQSMYDAIAREWVSQGCCTHAITFFASDTALRDLLYWNGFGLLVVDAIRPIEWDDRHSSTAIDAGITIRSATGDDLLGLARLDKELCTYLSESPIFLHHQEHDEQETAVRFLGEKVVSVVAEQDGRIMACIRGTDQKQDSCTIVQDESVMGINFGFTDPCIRGTGVGRAILEHVLEWGRSGQKTACAVDFESANVLGRSFWLRHFEAVCFSAIRFVDPRVTHSDPNH